jgi:hypothetical protein
VAASGSAGLSPPIPDAADGGRDDGDECEDDDQKAGSGT